MTGIDSYSITPATNATADGGSINWAEGQAPSTVNNTARQMLADTRALFNDSMWFQYGTGDQGSGYLAVPAVYASGTSFTITGADVTLKYEANRRVRAVGSGTGTIYGSISSTSYNAGNTTTTVNVTWDSGSLSNETLVVSLAQVPVTGLPVPRGSIAGITFSGAYSFTATLTAATAITFPTTGTLATLAGVEVLANKSITETVVVLTDGATPALDASLGNIFTLTAAGDRTIAVPTNATSGKKIIIRHTASGGARTLALNSGAGGFGFGSDITALTATASGKTDYIGCIYNAATSTWSVAGVVKGYA